MPLLNPSREVVNVKLTVLWVDQCMCSGIVTTVKVGNVIVVARWSCNSGVWNSWIEHHMFLDWIANNLGQNYFDSILRFEIQNIKLMCGKWKSWFGKHSVRSVLPYSCERSKYLIQGCKLSNINWWDSYVSIRINIWCSFLDSILRFWFLQKKLLVGCETPLKLQALY